MRVFGCGSRSLVQRGAPVTRSTACKLPAPSPTYTRLPYTSGESSTIVFPNATVHRGVPSVVATACSVPSHAPKYTVSPSTVGVLVEPAVPATRHASRSVPAFAGVIFVSKPASRLFAWSPPYDVQHPDASTVMTAANASSRRRPNLMHLPPCPMAAT